MTETYLKYDAELFNAKAKELDGVDGVRFNAWFFNEYVPANICELYTIYSKKVADKLRKKGFKVVTLGTNPDKPNFDTFLFEDKKI